VFIFPGFDRLRRLEQSRNEGTHGRVGRLSAAIAHEIRQPLTAMAGAVGELGAWCRWRKTKNPGEHCQRESERLNQIITDFLNLFARENL